MLTRLAVLHELADELERWSAFALGAVEQGTTSLRTATEQVRWAERSVALGRAFLRDVDRAAADANDQIEGLRLLLTASVGQLDAERQRARALTAAIDERRDTLRPHRIDLVRQLDHATREASAAAHVADAARVELRRSLGQSGSASGPLRVGRSKRARLAFNRAEERAREAQLAADRARAEVARRRAILVEAEATLVDLEGHRSALDATQQELDAIASQYEQLRERLDAIRQRCVTAAEQRRWANGPATQLSADAAESRRVLDQARAAAAAWQTAYERAQLSAVDATSSLRDRLENGGPE